DYATGGAQALSAELERPADEPAWTFAPPPTVGFWQRRQAHETAMHRVDAELASGAASPVEGDLAADGVDEWLHLLAYRPGRPAPAGTGETLHLHCTDRPGEWMLRLTPGGLEIEPTHAKGDVAARGPASDLLLVLLHRAPPEAVEVLGARPVLDAFLAETAF
ncbi:MAG TPA: maleylpyruvate isomerase N-terminal domain-containing protein, partial [Acidimicrobiia bacterium]|nr:maleylpyruvate isomerase N-terminal domain-containing protein [Acidimicrobiia bacterium]